MHHSTCHRASSTSNGTLTSALSHIHSPRLDRYRQRSKRPVRRPQARTGRSDVPLRLYRHVTCGRYRHGPTNQAFAHLRTDTGRSVRAPRLAPALLLAHLVAYLFNRYIVRLDRFCRRDGDRPRSDGKVQLSGAAFLDRGTGAGWRNSSRAFARFSI
jgi:hypothetical protein